MNWQDKKEVFMASALGEMSDILIKAMNWELEYCEFKKKMFNYIQSDEYYKLINDKVREKGVKTNE